MLPKASFPSFQFTFFFFFRRCATLLFQRVSKPWLEIHYRSLLRCIDAGDVLRRGGRLRGRHMNEPCTDAATNVGVAHTVAHCGASIHTAYTAIVFSRALSDRLGWRCPEKRGPPFPTRLDGYVAICKRRNTMRTSCTRTLHIKASQVSQSDIAGL